MNDNHRRKKYNKKPGVKFEFFTAVTMKTMKKREREVGSSKRHYGWGEQNISSVLKVPRHCPFVLLVIVSF
jgi:hypothetical protein